MKQLGNLAIVCASKKNVLLQVLDGVATVHVGLGSERKTIAADWHDDKQISNIISELNHGRYACERGRSA
ncbi:MAG: hypothetical protein FWH04_05810 [Oscillospiraceae bacterium]|nr:hypothetical protein [Oscillospiraceae bacterium]